MAGCWISIERQFQPEKDVKEPGHGIWGFIQWPSANQSTTNFFKVE